MPPHLHPRSTATSTLFAGTLLASFVVIGIPHVFPCPRPHRGYADAERQLDADGKPTRPPRRRAQLSSLSDDQLAAPVPGSIPSTVRDQVMSEEALLFRQLAAEAETLEKEARECPVPKPSGIVGRWLGFEEKKPVGKAEMGDKS